MKELMIFQIQKKIVRIENKGEDTDGESDKDSKSEDSSHDNGEEDRNAVRKKGHQARGKIFRAMRD